MDDFVFTKVIDVNGRIVLPAPLRKKYGLREGDTVSFLPLTKGIFIQPYFKEDEEDNE